MSRFRLMTSSWLPRKRSNVFDFFSDAHNLESLTPPFLRFSVQTPRPIRMGQGQLIDYSLKLHGFPISWRTEITDWEPPIRFEDSQLRGPYRHWAHTHTFEVVDGGTLMHDEVIYDVPGGSLSHSLFVRRDLKRIFTYRQEKLPELLGVSRDSCRIGVVEIQNLRRSR